jgi:hypothetical protein
MKGMTNRKSTLFMAGILLLAALGQRLAAQEPILNSYERNFMRVALSAKAGILRDAATDSRAPEFIGQLYDFALNFAFQNAELLRDDSDMISIAALAARGAGAAVYMPSLEILWKVFGVYRDSQTRTSVLGAIAVLGKGNIQTIEHLNQFLANQNSLYRSGVNPDAATLSACIAALAALGHSSSFPVLFTAMIAGYPGDIRQETEKALDRIEGDYHQYLTGVIRNNPLAEKLAAFQLGLASERLTQTERGSLAETALEAGLKVAPGTQESEPIAAGLRSQAIQVLTAVKWSRAAPLGVKYFYRIQTEYQDGKVPGERLLEAVECLGAMGGSEAAQTLALQLGYLNSQTERTGEIDEPLTLAVVNALGEIGDKIAFDYLLYVGYLSYPESIQAAAREALSRLQW